MSRRRIVVAIVVVLGWAALAGAEEAPTPPAATRALSNTPFQLVLPREHLLGDWYGVRMWLEDHGVTPTLTLVTDALGNPIGGARHGFRGASNLGLDLRFDLEHVRTGRGTEHRVDDGLHGGRGAADGYAVRRA